VTAILDTAKLSCSTLVLIARPLEFAATATPVVSSPAANVRLYDPADRVAPEVTQTTLHAAAVMLHVTLGTLPDPLSCPAGCGLPEKKFAGSVTVMVPPDTRSSWVTKVNVVVEEVALSAIASVEGIIILAFKILAAAAKLATYTLTLSLDVPMARPVEFNTRYTPTVNSPAANVML
jgi:hypothetical protein